MKIMWRRVKLLFKNWRNYDLLKARISVLESEVSLHKSINDNLQDELNRKSSWLRNESELYNYAKNEIFRLTICIKTLEDKLNVCTNKIKCSKPNSKSLVKLSSSARNKDKTDL